MSWDTLVTIAIVGGAAVVGFRALFLKPHCGSGGGECRNCAGGNPSIPEKKEAGL